PEARYNRMREEGKCTCRAWMLVVGIMGESRDMAAAAAEASRACASYLLRASAHTARMLHLVAQVMGCVGRGQLSPDTLNDAFAAFVDDRGAAAAAAAGQATARFLIALASSTWL